MSKKKKKENIGTISALDLLKATRGAVDVPFKTGAHNKKKPRERVNRNTIDKYL